MHDHDPQPWQCDDCGHVNDWDSTVCRCYFWDDEPTREPDNWEERHTVPAGKETIDDVFARYGFRITTSDQLAAERRQAFADMEAWYQIHIQEG